MRRHQRWAQSHQGPDGGHGKFLCAELGRPRGYLAGGGTISLWPQARNSFCECLKAATGDAKALLRAAQATNGPLQLRHQLLLTWVQAAGQTGARGGVAGAPHCHP